MMAPISQFIMRSREKSYGVPMNIIENKLNEGIEEIFDQAEF